MRLYLTRGLGLMKMFFLFSFTLRPHLPKYPSSISSSALSLFLCVYLPFSYLLASVFVFDVSLFFPSSHAASPYLSLRWIIAQRTGRPTQVQIMSLRRGRCCLSPERPSRVKITVLAIFHDIFSKNMSLRLMLK